MPFKSLGLFDPLYFMYAEDDDFCRRLHAAGLQVALVLKAVAWHAHQHVQYTQEDLKAARWKNSSELVFELKDPAHLFIRNIFKAVKVITFRFVNHAVHLYVARCLYFFIADLCILSMLPNIYRSRSKELCVVRSFRSAQLLKSETE